MQSKGRNCTRSKVTKDTLESRVFIGSVKEKTGGRGYAGGCVGG